MVLKLCGDSMRSKTPVPTLSRRTAYVLSNTSANRQVLKDYSKLMHKGQTTEAMSLILETVNGRAPLPLGNLIAPRPDGGPRSAKGNRGNLGEGIFAAAIAARFTHKNQPIATYDVQHMLTRLTGARTTATGKGGVIKELQLESLNENPAILDTVIFHLSLPEEDMTALQDKAGWTLYRDIFTSAVVYANAPTVTAWSRLLYENNQKNKIEVSSVGLENQSTSKVDVRVIVDNIATNINVSLKVGEVKQFGQIGGSKLENMQTLFGPLGVTLAGIKTEYNGLLASKRPQRAMWLAYVTAQAQMTRQLLGPHHETWLKKLGDFIAFHATRNEENVTLVQLSREDAHVYDFDKVHTALAQLTVKVLLKQSGDLPMLRIIAGQDESKHGLLDIRCRYDQKPSGAIYVRNYIEKGIMLGELIGQSLG